MVPESQAAPWSRRGGRHGDELRGPVLIAADKRSMFVRPTRVSTALLLSIARSVFCRSFDKNAVARLAESERSRGVREGGTVDSWRPRYPSPVHAPTDLHHTALKIHRDQQVHSTLSYCCVTPPHSMGLWLALYISVRTAIHDRRNTFQL